MASVFLLDPTNALLDKVTVVPQTIASATTVNGTGVDCSNTEGPVHCKVVTGNCGDSTLTLTLTLQESNDDGSTDAYATVTGFTAVSYAGATLADNLSIWLSAHDHTKKWLRLSVTTAGGGTLSVPIAASIVATKKISGSGNGSYTGY